MSSFKNFGLHLKNNSTSPVAITGHLGIFANADQVSIVNYQSNLRDIRVRDMISDTAHVSGASFLAGTVNALSNVVVSGNESISGFLSIRGNTNALSDLIVSNNASISGKLTVTGVAKTLSDLIVYGNEGISGSLSVNGITNIGSLVATSGSLSSLTVTNNATISGSLRAISGLSVGNSNGYSFPTTKGLEGNVLGVSGSQVSFISLSNYALASSLPSVTGSCLTQSSLTPYALTSTVTGISDNLQSQITSSNSVTGSYLTVNSNAVSGDWLIGSNLTVTSSSLLKGDVNISGNLNISSNVVTSGTLGFKGYNIVPISGTFMVTPDMIGKIIHLTGPSNILLPQALNFNGDHFSFKAATNDSSIISGGIGNIDTLETLGLTGLSFKEVYFYDSNWFTK
jgi:predicted acyltransferase (DUF342 family)